MDRASEAIAGCRVTKNRKWRIGILAALLVSASIMITHHLLGWGLPKIPLRGGGEFRVYQIRYTPGPSDFSDHNLHCSKLSWVLWRSLPSALQDRVPTPSEGISGMVSDHPVLTLWWTWIEPKTRKPMLGPSGDVLMTLDSGERLNLGWADPSDDYRQIFITDPPMNSKYFRFHVPVDDESVDFTIKNPAYRRSP